MNYPTLSVGLPTSMLTVLVSASSALFVVDYRNGFIEYILHDYAGEIRDSWIWEHINSHIAQKIATRAFKAVQKKAFGKAKNVPCMIDETNKVILIQIILLKSENSPHPH